jgi:surfactin synthase thioesterase subunit
MINAQLFLLHFAGGNNYSFQFIRPFLGDFEFTPLELPGRGKRMRESLIRNLSDAANDVCRQLLMNQRSPHFIIYGHSMGATLALKAAALLEELGKYPLHIIVSGNPGPHVTPHSKKYLLPDARFREELRRIGGMPDEVLANEELFNFFAPIIKADFEVVEKMEDVVWTPVRTPVYAIMGDKEECADRIDNWARFTVSDFRSEIMEGNHFFIYDHAQEIAAVIKNCYRLWI